VESGSRGIRKQEEGKIESRRTIAAGGGGVHGRGERLSGEKRARAFSESQNIHIRETSKSNVGGKKNGGAPNKNGTKETSRMSRRKKSGARGGRGG